ncbi:MAG: recombinase family protein, partial [Clostridia bacterium]|nr:recombinase family protein [Clostridia bacterium]
LKARGLNTNRRGKVWNTARLSEMMRNPIYTTNDISIYHFFKQQGSNLINPPEQFDGITSQYLFKGENTNRKTWDLSGQNIVIAPHRGFIPPDIWIACRKKLLANHQIKTCKAKNSFLSGKIKCGNCGYAIVVRFSQRSKGHVRYFIDTGWTQNHCCSHKLPTIHADDFEAMIVDKLKAKIDTLTIRAKAGAKDETQEQRKELEIKISKIESEIEALVNTMTKSEVDKVTIKYINSKIAELDEERTSVLNELDRLKTEQSQKNNTDYKVLRDVMSKWEKLSFDDKRSVVELLVRKILVYPDKVEREWNI